MCGGLPFGLRGLRRSRVCVQPEDDGKRWVAQFDYAAADGDEVSFADGDIIIKVTVVDEGWVKVLTTHTPTHPACMKQKGKAINGRQERERERERVCVV